MAYGENAEKYGHPGKEYWGSRPGSRVPSKWSKRVTQRLERTEKRHIIKQIAAGWPLDDGTASREG